jgi:hypothetical protein
VVAMVMHSVLSLRILFRKARGPGESYMIASHFTTIVGSGLLIPASFIVIILGASWNTTQRMIPQLLAEGRISFRECQGVPWATMTYRYSSGDCVAHYRLLRCLDAPMTPDRLTVASSSPAQTSWRGLWWWPCGGRQGLSTRRC